MKRNFVISEGDDGGGGWGEEVEYEIEYKGVNASEEVTGQESDRRQQS